MAKFVYRMQSILDIKLKLEEQAKQQFMMAQARLNDAEAELGQMKQRKEDYTQQYRKSIQQKLDLLDLDYGKNAILYMDQTIENHMQVIRRLEQELEHALVAMNEAIKERKIYEKLKENQFETFLQEINEEEMKEIDQLVSYQYNDAGKEGRN